MDKGKQRTLDRYEHGLMVRALYDLRKQMCTENAPAEDIEDLIPPETPRIGIWEMRRREFLKKAS